MSFSQTLQAALSFAAELHHAQTRKGTDIPYFSHLLAVCSIVMEESGTETQCIAGLLHDSLEDCGTDYPGGSAQLRTDISDRFGPEVLGIIEQCTDTEEQPKPPWKERKLQYIKHLSDIDSETRLVIMADKLHNIRSIIADHQHIGPDVWNRFSASATETKWFYTEVVQALTHQQPMSRIGLQLQQSVNLLCALPEA